MKWYLASVVTALTLIVVALNMPAQYLSVNYWLRGNNFGAVALTDITGSNQLSNFPATYTANNTILEDVLNSIIGTTTNTTITSLANLATVGTLTGGTWNANTITVPYGGTGSTTLHQYAVLLGSSTNPIHSVDGLGTSGQFLTSNGAGTKPSWTTAAIDQSANYLWTGIHNFANAATYIKGLTSSTTVTFSNSGAGVSFVFPLSQGASSTVLATNGSGTLTWASVSELGAGKLLVGSTTDETIADSIVENVYGAGGLATTSGSILGTSGGLRVRAAVTAFSDSGGNTTVTFRLKLGTTEVCATNITASTNVANGFIDFYLFNTSATTQVCMTYPNLLNAAAVFSTPVETTSSVDTSAPLGVNVGVQWDGNDGGETETATIIGVQAWLTGK